MALAQQIAKRLVALALVLFLVTLFTSYLLSLAPGDPVSTLVPLNEGDPRVEEMRSDLKERLHLDKPFVQRYGYWLGDFVSGDFGSRYTVSGKDPVSDHVKDALPVTLQLIFYSQVLALVVAVPLGVATAYRAGSFFDRSTNATAFGLLSIPNFVLGLALAYYVGVWLHWLPNTGSVSYTHLTLPTIYSV